MFFKVIILFYFLYININKFDILGIDVGRLDCWIVVENSRGFDVEIRGI